MPKLLIVDDERGSRESLRLVFSREYDVQLAALALEHGGKRRRKSVGWLETERLDVCVREVGITHTDGDRMGETEPS